MAKKKVKWIELDATKETHVGGKAPFGWKVFGWNGKKWPRLVIGLWPHLPEGLAIGVSTAKNSNSWWVDAAIPAECIPHLIELLQQAKGPFVFGGGTQDDEEYDEDGFPT